MPQNKIQHYVPKCHLRMFSSDGKAINLFNFEHERLIHGAPIKGQCARNYFYGKDGELERALQEPEGIYATIISKITSDPNSVTVNDLSCLRQFTLLQSFRTFGYVEKLMSMTGRFEADIEAAAPAARLPPRMFSYIGEAVVAAIGHFLKTRHHVNDLETCLIVNKSRKEFVTSDDPVIHTNRFHFQKTNIPFGLSSSGALFFLPLTPRIIFAMYDSNIYYAPNKNNNIVETNRDDEVSILNELQFLHARQNLYFSDPAIGSELAADYKKYAPSRPAAWNKTSYFEKVSNEGGRERFARADVLAPAPGREFLTVVEQVHVKPSRWTRLFNYRIRPQFVDTGTAAGIVRPNHPALRERN
jgi:hypothetical protein